MLPDLLITLFGLGSGVQALVVGNTTLVVNGKLTAAGWLHFFVWRPFVYFVPMGAVGSLVAWLVAVGFRVKQPLRATSG